MPYRYHYDPNQPRVPAGQHDGGEWARGGNANPILQRVQYDPHAPRRSGRRSRLEDVLALFNRLSRRNSDNAKAVVGFNAREYKREDPDAFSENNVALLTRDDVNRICKRLELVQMLTDGIALAERPFMDKMSPTQYGTRIHSMLKRIIDDRKDPDFRAEVSVLKWLEEKKAAHEPLESNPGEVKYGTKNSVRIDVYEKTSPTTVCVYDIKTGESGLSPARFNEITRSVFNAYKDVQHIIITEVRPTQ